MNPTRATILMAATVGQDVHGLSASDAITTARELAGRVVWTIGPTDRTFGPKLADTCTTLTRTLHAKRRAANRKTTRRSVRALLASLEGKS